MKELLQKMAAYNLWANQKIINCIQQQEQALWYQQTPSSFETLYKTILHMWDAESAWWQRIKLQERIVAPSQNTEPSLKEASDGLLSQSTQWEAWIKAATEMALQHVFQYSNLRKEQFKQPVFETVMHVFNHGTYHRGQLVTMLRQLGVTSGIPQTDFAFWCRGQK
jgi:uncharacterized damage-inducible protein DinB